MLRLVLLLAPVLAFDCELGCNLRGPVVCDADGVRYANACLAYCQVRGERVAFGNLTRFFQQIDAGPCYGRSSSSIKYADSEELVSLSTMNRFPGFTLMGKIEDFDTSTDDDDDEPDEPVDDPVDPYMPLTAVRLTSDGLEYRAQPTTARRRNLRQSPTAPQLPLDWTPAQVEHYRNLIVLGTDTRTRVADTTQFPYSAVVELDSRFREGGCSGILIAPHVVLTAGHCLYSTASNQWKSVTTIAPGRTRVGSSTHSPWGRWTVTDMVVLQEYRDGRGSSFDLGVAIVAPTIDDMCNVTFPGDKVGYVGLAPATDDRLQQVSIIGYPAEKPDGTMWDSGVCSNNQGWSKSGVIGFHYCDTSPGMSGSAFLSNGDTAVGVHAYGFEALSRNGGVLLLGSFYDQVLQWSQTYMSRDCEDQQGTLSEPGYQENVPQCQRILFIGPCKY